MNASAASSILATIVCLTVAIAVLFRRPRRAVYDYFTAYCFALALWHAASFANRLATLSELQTAGALLLPSTALLFYRELLRDRSRLLARLTRLSFVIGGLLLALVLSPWGNSIAVRLATSAFVGAAMFVVARILQRAAREARSDMDRKRLRFLLYVSLSAALLGAAEIIPQLEVATSIGHVAVTLYVYFLYQSIITRRLIDMVELLAKTAMLAVLTLLLAIIYFLLVRWVGEGRPGLWLFNTLVASFVILILYDQVRPWVETTTVKLAFRERYDFRQALLPLLRALRTTLSLDEMRERVLTSLGDIKRVHRVALYVASDDGELSFDLLGYRGDKMPATLSLTVHPSLLQEIRRERRPVLLDELQNRYQELPAVMAAGDATEQRERERIAEAIGLMRSLAATAVLPMVAKERLVGLLIVGTPDTIDSYSTDEVAALLSLADVCGIVIENSQEFEKRRERDRLVAVGEMAAGLAHEIRNPLGAIKGAVQCLEPGDLKSESVEFLGVIVEEVDRLNGVVEQFLEYARPFRGTPTLVNANEVVSATVRLLGRDALPDNIEIKQELQPDLPAVRLDPEQLKQVLINLVLNAIQAMPEGGKLTVRTRGTVSRGSSYTPALGIPRPAPGLRPVVIVRVEDTGKGIPAEELRKIFLPFYTTKSNGTGLGLAISQRIIETAGGRIEVSSRPGVGSIFTLRLPADVPEDNAADASRASELGGETTV